MSLVAYGSGGASGSMQIPPLAPTNYTSSAIKVEAILEAQGLWGVVGSAEGPAIDVGRSKTARAMLPTMLLEVVLTQVAPKPTGEGCATGDAARAV
ncbi:retrotransposon protein [Hordeum vulgare]|nr:retrotransposon protein [Hordeum vulgare]